ncbi:MAG: SGNH/GDSL hydrolase family protein, partial [Dehalococcoidia bacterium]
GVASARDGYVSRFHNQLQLRDGAEYGLRNFGVSGESSGTLIRLGQLDAAIDFMEDNDVSYVSIDIGANDLLGHIYSPECSESFSDPACQERLSIVTAAYTSNIGDILERIEDAAPDATIIFLTSYNPFSFGLPNSEFEAVTNAAVDALNDVAAAAAEERGMVVADGFGALAGTTAGTTHMTDPDPDIHPKAIGYDLLAAALLAALR